MKSSLFLAVIDDSMFLCQSHAHHIDGLKIFRFEGSLYFASCEKFYEKLYLRTGLNPREVLWRTARSAPRAAASPQLAPTQPKNLELRCISGPTGLMLPLPIGRPQLGQLLLLLVETLCLLGFVWYYSEIFVSVNIRLRVWVFRRQQNLNEKLNLVINKKSVLLATAEYTRATAHRKRAYSEVSLSAFGHLLEGFAELLTISEHAASDVANWNVGADPSTRRLCTT